MLGHQEVILIAMAITCFPVVIIYIIWIILNKRLNEKWEKMAGDLIMYTGSPIYEINKMNKIKEGMKNMKTDYEKQSAKELKMRIKEMKGWIKKLKLFDSVGTINGDQVIFMKMIEKELKKASKALDEKTHEK